MDLKTLTEGSKTKYNQVVTHVIQSWQWGDFRKRLGTPVLRYGLYKNNQMVMAFQLTLHQIPFTNWNVGYLPKGPFPNTELAKILKKIGKEHNCAFIKVEPNIQSSQSSTIDKSFILSPKPLFTKNNFIIDLTQSEDELLKNLHSKTRYNIKIAQKYQVKVENRSDDRAFEIYLKLYFETCQRQDYHGHNEAYHRKAWESLRDAHMARIMIGSYQQKPLVAWMLLSFKDTFYYPYGGSSDQYKYAMANNLVAWEAIKLGKKLGLKKFDMWGALSKDADPMDPFFGFHRFKAGYGGKLVEYIGTYDLVLNYPLYYMFNVIDKLMPLKLFLLRLLKK